MEFDGNELEFVRSSNYGTVGKAKGQSCPLVTYCNFIDLFIYIGGAIGDEDQIICICSSRESNVSSAKVTPCVTTC